MIFKPWTPDQFEARGFIQVGAIRKWERLGFPLYAAPSSPKVWMPRWAADLYCGFKLHESLRSSFDDDLARLSVIAIRSDDPDAFVEAVLAAYTLGGWEAALQLAGAQDAEHEQTLPEN